MSDPWDLTPAQRMQFREAHIQARNTSPAETAMRGDYAPTAAAADPEYRVIYQFGGTEAEGIRAHATREEAEAEGREADDPGLDGWHVEPPACASCGTEEGPDRQARWEAGVPQEQLGEWDACERISYFAGDQEGPS